MEVGLQALGRQLGGRRGRWRDGARGVFADPDAACVKYQARGRQISGSTRMHLSEPSPQRTPVLYQAGSSPARSRSSRAGTPEAMFVSGPSAKDVIRAARRGHSRAAPLEAGRAPG